MPRVEYPLIPASQVPSSGSEVVEFFGRQLHLVRDSDGEPAAYMNVCPHFGGTLACVDGRFRCEWHGATFDGRSGARTAGVAPEGSRLTRLPTEVRDGVVTYVFEWEEPE
jgi:3-phenylpropionate/trans-cinnamate dioxygenase ferredoxin subunit